MLMRAVKDSLESSIGRLSSSSANVKFALLFGGKLLNFALSKVYPIFQRVDTRFSEVITFVAWVRFLDMSKRDASCSAALVYSINEDLMFSRTWMVLQAKGALAITKCTSRGPPLSDLANILVYMMQREMNDLGNSLS